MYMHRVLDDEMTYTAHCTIGQTHYNTASETHLQEVFGVVLEDWVERQVVDVTVLVAAVVVEVHKVLNVVVRPDVLNVLQ